MATVHVEGWRAAGAKVAAIHARKSKRADAFADAIGAPLISALDEFMADVDVVDICAPTHTHYDLIAAAAEAGRNVVCEKPLARTSQLAAKAVRCVRRLTSRCWWGTS